MKELKAVFYKHPRVGSTTGRIACTLEAFLAVGGYWEGLLPAGSQDVFFMKCLSSLMGRSHTLRFEANDVGAALANSREVRQGKKGFFKSDCAEKVANVDKTLFGGMTWSEMIDESWRRCKAYMQKGLQLPINGPGKEIGVGMFEECPLDIIDG